MPYEGWETEELSDQGLKAFFDASQAKWERSERDARQFGWRCLAAAGVGCVFGLIGMASALTVYLKVPAPPPFGYVLIDKSDGHFEQPVAAKDAPRLFPESVRERALRDFISSCESYVPQTWARIEYHACMVQATPDEQKRRAADIGVAGAPHYPPGIFGPAGWAMPTDFLSFVKLAETGTAPNQTFSYQVRYARTEVINGHETRPRYTAMVTFAFHPELRISDADRLINPPGLQVISFSTVKD